MDVILIPQFGLPKLAMAYVEANVKRLFESAPAGLGRMG